MRESVVVAILCGFVATPQAQENDFHAEILQWVVEPCMSVAAAIGVKDLEADQLELGIGRKHVEAIMVTSRDTAAREMAGNMDPNATWETRRAAYPALLRLCLQGVIEKH